MRFINKRNKKNRKRAHRMVKAFLRQTWLNDGANSHYVNCSFSEFKRILPFRRLLFQEQRGFCCYCMRKLTLVGAHSNATLEHVMPHNVKCHDSAFYFARVSIFKKLVKVKKLDGVKQKCGVRPYPHFCAYENLVLSCDGSIFQTENPDAENARNLHQCCNNARGYDQIEPLFFDSRIDTNFVYENDGLITCGDEYENSIRVLKLENSTLVMIRRGWAKLVKGGHNLMEVKKALEDVESRKLLVDDMNLPMAQQRRLMNKLYWTIFSEYSWFYDYYKNRI